MSKNSKQSLHVANHGYVLLGSIWLDGCRCTLGYMRRCLIECCCALPLAADAAVPKLVPPPPPPWTVDMWQHELQLLQEMLQEMGPRPSRRAQRKLSLEQRDREAVRPIIEEKIEHAKAKIRNPEDAVFEATRLLYA